MTARFQKSLIDSLVTVGIGFHKHNEFIESYLPQPIKDGALIALGETDRNLACSVIESMFDKGDISFNFSGNPMNNNSKSTYISSAFLCYLMLDPNEPRPRRWLDFTLDRIIESHRLEYDSDVIGFCIDLLKNKLNENLNRRNFSIFTSLLNKLKFSKNICIWSSAISCLEDLSFKKEQGNKFMVVTSLKKCLINLIKNNDFDFYRDRRAWFFDMEENDFQVFQACYTVVWYCSQEMSYPEFYEAWNA